MPCYDGTCSRLTPVALPILPFHFKSRSFKIAVQRLLKQIFTLSFLMQLGNEQSPQVSSQCMWQLCVVVLRFVFQAKIIGFYAACGH